MSPAPEIVTVISPHGGDAGRDARVPTLAAPYSQCGDGYASPAGSLFVSGGGYASDTWRKALSPVARLKAGPGSAVELCD